MKFYWRLFMFGLIFLEISCGSNKFNEHSNDQAFIDSKAIWHRNPIQVCWENADPTGQEQIWVKEAVKATWQKHSNLQFWGWIPCQSGDPALGIRIAVVDTHPHVLDLGNRLDGWHNGVVLNAKFENWGFGCKNNRELCIKAIAVHEFGHVLGFAHEQNRPDRPDTCQDAPQGRDGTVILGDFDKDSVMSYCNPIWNNNGNLSAGDIVALQKYYGAPPSPQIEPTNPPNSPAPRPIPRKPTCTHRHCPIEP